MLRLFVDFWGSKKLKERAGEGNDFLSNDITFQKHHDRVRGGSSPRFASSHA